MDRKDFFSKVMIGGGLIFLGPAILNSCSKSGDTPSGNNGGNNGGTPTIDLSSSSFSSLQTVGGYAYSGNIIIIRTSTSNYVALTKICTHQGCTVTYDSSADKIICPCHGSQYNTSGTVLLGPAPSPLKMYTVTVDGKSLKIS
jgi:cytochrome b6-f complex iron-sulfur subunit